MSSYQTTGVSVAAPVRIPLKIKNGMSEIKRDIGIKFNLDRNKIIADNSPVLRTKRE